MSTRFDLSRLAIGGIVVLDSHQALRDMPVGFHHALTADLATPTGVKLWVYDPTGTVADDDNRTLIPTSGVGRWYLKVRIVGADMALPEGTPIRWEDGSLIYSQGGVLMGQDTNTQGTPQPLFPTNIQLGPGGQQ